MPKSLQELSDRLEIQDLLVRYCTSVDRQDWPLYESCFLPDATIDYTEAGGIKGTTPEVSKWLSEVMPVFPKYQHLIANSEITLDGDRATGRTMLLNPQGLQEGDRLRIGFVGLWYNDTFVRTDDGWKFASRYEEVSWFHNWPDDFQVPEAGK
jgi:hypothetical protein